MKRVAVLNQFALPRSEGGATRHIDLFGRLSGWVPVIIGGNRSHYTQERFSTTDPRFRLVAVPVHRGSAVARLVGWLVYAAQAFGVTVTIRDLKLVYGSSPQPLAAVAGLVAARLRRVPFVLEVRDLWPESIVAAGKISRESLVYRAGRRLESWLATRADRIVCVTKGWEEHFARLGVARSELVVVPNGTEPRDFEVGEPRGVLRRRHRVDGFTAVFAGAHGEKDGIDLILDAARLLPQMHFLLVGAGPAKPGAVLRTRREGLENVEFRDPVPKEHLAELLRACDVGVHAVSPLSVFNNGMSPNKLFDYLAAELPVVSNAAGPLRRIIRDGECGRLGNYDSLAACLNDVRRAGAVQQREWGARSRAIVESRFSRSRAASVLEATLDEVAASGRAATR